jgi:two-component system, NarL family, sensor histidine kinase DevS
VPEHDAERFWRIIEAAPDGFVMVDLTGTIVLVNAQTERLFGYDRGELVGQPVEILLPEPVRSAHVVERDRYIAHPHTRAMGIGLDLVGLHRGGHEFPVEVSLSPLDDESIIAVVRDVRARRDAEALLRSAEEHVRLLEDRDRIARDLHDHVIQRLFAAGMALEGAVARSDDADVNARVTGVVDDLDDTIRQLRSVIFDLQDRGRDRSVGLRSELLGVVAEARPALGHEPRVRFDGPIDTMGDAVSEHVLAVLREALTNVGRHAHASATDVHVVATADEFVLDVTDDGVGPPETPGLGNGLGNLERRAAKLGGTFAFGPGPNGGSRFHWQIPLDR